MSACSTSRGFKQTKLERHGLRSAYVNWEKAALDSNEDKPVLRALELLSKNCTDSPPLGSIIRDTGPFRQGFPWVGGDRIDLLGLQCGNFLHSRLRVLVRGYGWVPGQVVPPLPGRPGGRLV